MRLFGTMSGNNCAKAVMDNSQQGSQGRRWAHPRYVIEIDTIMVFIGEKEKQGLMDPEHCCEILGQVIWPLADQGYDLGTLQQLDHEQAGALKGTLRTAAHLMKQRLLDLYPELADELQQAIKKGQSK